MRALSLSQQAHVIRREVRMQQLPMPDVAKRKTQTRDKDQESPASRCCSDNQQQRDKRKKEELSRDNDQR